MTLDQKARTILARRGEEQRRATTIRDQAIADAVAKGASLREVADAVGLSHMGVQAIVRRHKDE